MPPEDPWDAWRKRAMGDFPDFFADFEKEFARMQGMFNRIMNDAMKHASSPQRGDPFVYGFTMRVGPDGMPRIEPFGSAGKPGGRIPGTAPGAQAIDTPPADAREPLTDVLETDREVTVTVELPGVEKKDVQLHVAEDAVTVRVDTARKYHKRMRLPAKVLPSSAKATFKNGVLDVTLQRKVERKDPGQRVDIE